MTQENIVWNVIQEPDFDACASIGSTTTSEEIGTYGDKKFARFRVWEAYLGYKCIDYKIIQQTIIPL
jgi:hypothetical protein